MSIIQTIINTIVRHINRKIKKENDNISIQLLQEYNENLKKKLKQEKKKLKLYLINTQLKTQQKENERLKQENERLKQENERLNNKKLYLFNALQQHITDSVESFSRIYDSEEKLLKDLNLLAKTRYNDVLEEPLTTLENAKEFFYNRFIVGNDVCYYITEETCNSEDYDCFPFK